MKKFRYLISENSIITRGELRRIIRLACKSEFINSEKENLFIKKIMKRLDMECLKV